MRILTLLLPLQMLLVALCVVVVRWRLEWSHIGFGPIRWLALLWLAPSITLMAYMVADLTLHLSWEMLREIGWVSLCLLIVVPILIAFSEEVMFRGILLRGAMCQMSTVSAMLMSAAVFASMHAISGFVVLAFWPTLHQVALTFCVGLFLAPVALALGTLWPLITWHAAWNFIVFGSELVQVDHPQTLPGLLIQFIWCLPLWNKAIRTERD